MGIDLWYLCFTKPQRETLAAERLAEQGYKVAMPFFSVWQLRRGKWQLQQKPMFPRYAFVQPSSARQSIAPIQSTPGVSNLVRFGPLFATLSGARVQAMQALAKTTADLQPGQPFEPGAHVLFLSGPLKGFAGIVSAVAGERVSVMLSMLGHDHTVTVPLQQLACA